MEETPKAEGRHILRKKRNLFSLPGLPKKEKKTLFFTVLFSEFSHIMQVGSCVCQPNLGPKQMQRGHLLLKMLIAVQIKCVVWNVLH